MTYQEIIDRHYPAGTLRRDIFLKHSRQVANKALEIAHNKALPLTDEEITTAAMLHDIGIFMTDAVGIDCHGTELYLMHGVLGANLLRESGIDEKYARVAERHTGAGITAEEINAIGLPLPNKDLTPETLLERLVCYADKFYSKSGEMKEKPLERIRISIAKFGPASAARFETLHQEFSTK